MSSTVGTPGAEVALSRWWRVVGGLLMNLALGSLYAWSVFVAPLEKEFGWKRADTSQVFTWAVVVFRDFASSSRADCRTRWVRSGCR